MTKCGYNVVHPKHFFINRPHGSGDALFLFFRSVMEVERNGRFETVNKNSVLIYRRGSKQLYRCADEKMVHDWFHFENEEAERFIEALGLPYDTPLQAYDPFYISWKIREIHAELLQNGKHRELLVDAAARSLFMKLADTYERTDAKGAPVMKHYESFTAIRGRIYASPALSYTIDALAAEANMSRSHFQFVYRKLFGIPVHQDVVNSRLQYAMRLLEMTKLSVGMIAEKCGYENDVHFMRQFKKYVRKTPSEYRAGRTRYEEAKPARP